MKLKLGAFQAQGSTAFNLYSPHLALHHGTDQIAPLLAAELEATALGVAVQVDPFDEEQILKPGYHVSGSRVETRRFQAMGQLVQPRHRREAPLGGGHYLAFASQPSCRGAKLNLKANFETRIHMC